MTVYENGMIGYRYVDRQQQEKEPVVVTEDIKEKMEEWQRKLAKFWGENEKPITYFIVIGGLLSMVATEGGTAPAYAASIILLLIINRKLENQTECDMS